LSKKNNRLKNFFYLFTFLIAIWLALTTTFQWQELSIGIFISLVLALFLNKNYLKLGLPPISIKRIIFFILYISVLFIEIVKANLDVAYRIIHPKMPIKPGIVIIKTKLKQDIAKTILANSITLTPGTFTLDIKGDELLIHWIIGQKFEKYLKVVFG
jgi:multicomponent Na+:H+ antiporter subunit E